LFNLIEESIKKAIEPFVFEPNDAGTWNKIKSLITNYLAGLWKSGAMQGDSEDEAFYVAAGLDETMTAQDIQEGRLIMEIGVAAVRPAEFIVVRFKHTMAES
jgi:phage tail sheath protein FI